MDHKQGIDKSFVYAKDPVGTKVSIAKKQMWKGRCKILRSKSFHWIFKQYELIQVLIITIQNETVKY